MKLCRLCGQGLSEKREAMGVCVRCVAGLTKEAKAAKGTEIKKPSYGRISTGRAGEE